MAVCLSSSSSYLVSLEPVEEGERVNRHGANNEENVEDGECDQELVEEMGPAHPSGSEERVFNVCDALAVEVAFPFPPPPRYSLPALLPPSARSSLLSSFFIISHPTTLNFPPAPAFPFSPRSERGRELFWSPFIHPAYFIAM